jgi:hypothetical protein
MDPAVIILIVVVVVVVLLLILFLLRGTKKSGKMGGSVKYAVVLVGDKEVPPVVSAAKGTLTANYNPSTRVMSYDVRSEGVIPSAAHFHLAPVGVSGPIIMPIEMRQENGTVYRATGNWTLTPEQAIALMAGRVYVNVHSIAYPNGEIRAQL